MPTNPPTIPTYTDNQPALAACRRHDVDVEGQLLDYALRDGELTNVYSMARLKRRER